MLSNRIPAVVFMILAIIQNAVCQSVSTVKDREGNVYAIKLFPDNKLWMTQNLNINIPGSYCYDNAEQNCKRYGRLYTWQSAQEACLALGDGWRLPTNEDWQTMARFFGGVGDDSKDSGRTAFKAFLIGGPSGFNTQFGGGRSADGKEYARIEAHGFYWTATTTDTTTAWLYNLGKNGKMVNRHNDTEKKRAFSVRCIHDAE